MARRNREPGVKNSDGPAAASRRRNALLVIPGDVLVRAFSIGQLNGPKTAKPNSYVRPGRVGRRRTSGYCLGFGNMFTTNMALPVHGWFRYSAGFSAQWVAAVIGTARSRRRLRVLDPFVGSGTTLIAAQAT